MLRREFKTALRAVHRPLPCLKLVAPAQPWHQILATRRRFSVKPFEPPFLDQGELPLPTAKEKSVVFDRTSSSELDSILVTILHRIILPSHLPLAKKRFIAREKNRQRLLVDPVTIEIDGYEHTFSVLDYEMGDIPKSQPLLRQAFRLMQTREDWANLVRLLAGLTKANRKFKAMDFQLMIQVAGRTGNIYAVLDALVRNKESGLEVRTLNLADNLLHYIAAMAWQGGYAYKDTKRASQWSRRFLEILAGRSDPRLATKPQVIGQALHLAAAEAVFHNEGQDVDEAVVEFTTSLIREWKTRVERVPKPADNRPHGLLDIHPSSERDLISGSQIIHAHRTEPWYLHLDPSRHIAVACYMIKGIELASQVLPDHAGDLAPIREGIELELQQYVDRREGTNAFHGGKMKPAKLGWMVYDSLMVDTGKPLNWGLSKKEVEAQFATQDQDGEEEKKAKVKVGDE
jgi:hypothetical protein